MSTLLLSLRCGDWLADWRTTDQCRLPHYIPRETKRAYARSLLKILGLEKKANRVIGNHAGDGISNDERKRVTMGVEMAADPAILFLDEVPRLAAEF